MARTAPTTRSGVARHAGRALLLLALLAPLTAATGGTPDREQPEPRMTQRILVHITHGPEHPTRAALGFAVAEAALRQGHDVTLFLAGDAVQLARTGVLDNLNGLGTGNLRQLHDALVAGGASFYLSGGSSRARGLAATDVTTPNVEFAAPDRLVELALEHDRMFTY